MLCTIRHLVNKSTLRFIYFWIFRDLISYDYTAWGQQINHACRLSIIPKKEIRITSFTEFDAPTNPLFFKLKFMWLVGLISMENCIFIIKCFSFVNNSPFLHSLANNVHSRNTKSLYNGLLGVPSCSTLIFL